MEDRGSYTLQQWCKRHGISRAMFYILRKDGKAPRSFQIGRCVRVSIEADKDWVSLRELDHGRTARADARDAA